MHIHIYITILLILPKVCVVNHISCQLLAYLPGICNICVDRYGCANMYVHRSYDDCIGISHYVKICTLIRYTCDASLPTLAMVEYILVIEMQLPLAVFDQRNAFEMQLDKRWWKLFGHLSHSTHWNADTDGWCYTWFICKHSDEWWYLYRILSNLVLVTNVIDQYKRS